MTRGELIGKIDHFLKGIGYRTIDVHKWLTYKFLLYLVEQNLITKEEADRIERFHSNHIINPNNIIYFKLIEELFNKHCK